MAANDEGAGPNRATSSWERLAARSVEIALAVVIGGAAAFLLRTTGDAYFVGDDWGLIDQAGSIRGMLEPYNDHLSLTILGLYRALVELFGFSYTPFRVAGVVCFVAIPVTYFLAARHLLGPALAGIAALSMLGLGGTELHPAVLNHYLVLVAGIGCAVALNRGRGADWAVTAGLALALSAAGGGVAVAAACVVHNLCTRATARRWLTVAVPLLGWGAWWFVAARGNPSRFSPTVKPSLSEALRYARDVVVTPFEYAGLDNPFLAVLVASAFLAYGWWRLRQGLDPAANFVGWTAALGVWAIGLAYGRGARATGEALQESDAVLYRYRLLALGFVLLAILPRRRIAWPGRSRIAHDPRWLPLVAALVLAIALVRGMAVRDDIEARAAWFEGYGTYSKAELLILDLGPDAIPDDVPMDDLYFGLRAGEVRTLVERYGSARTSTPATVDRQLVELGVASVQLRPPGNRPCRPLAEPILWLPTSGRPLSLSSDQTAWTIQVRRFGSDWVTLAELTAGQRVALDLPPLAADEPWQVRAEGACRTGPVE